MSLTTTLRAPEARRRRVGLVSPTSSCILPLMLLAVRTPETVSVNDPRPLHAAVKVLEQCCGCAITYEDPRWGPDDVDNISGSVGHRPDVRVRVSKGGRFTFDAPPGLFPETPAQTRDAVADVLRAFAEAGSGR